MGQETTNSGRNKSQERARRGSSRHRERWGEKDEDGKAG
jgi:hypothetical protein